MLRPLVVLVAVLLGVAAAPAAAQPDAGAALLGSWRILSYRVQVVGEADARDIMGPSPVGRIIFTPERRMVVFITRHDRRPPGNEAEAAALLRSMLAFSGPYRVEGDRFIVSVDTAWNEVSKQAEQVRHFVVERDRLTVRSPEQPSATVPGQRVVASLVFERER